MSETTNSGLLGQWDLDAGEWFYSGHLPGFPITPGVLVLGRSCQEARRQVPEIGDAPVKEIPVTKFRRPSHPGDTLVFSVGDAITTSAGDVSVPVQAHLVDGSLSCETTVVFGERDTVPPAGDIRLSGQHQIDPTTRIPHRDPFLFLDEIIHLAADEVRAVWSPPSTHHIVTAAGDIPWFALIEAGAQAMGSQSDSPTARMFFASIRQAQVFYEPPAGAPVLIVSRLIARSPDSVRAQISVATPTGVALTATVMGSAG